jgi:hypothetical protein
MMITDVKLYLMLHEETDYSPDYGQFVSGSDPVSAVERHYAEMDAWCSPVRDPDFYEEFCVCLHEIPKQLAEPVQQQFESLRGGEYTAATEALLTKYPDIKGVQLNVILTAEGGAAASLMPDEPHFVSGFGKS